MRKTTAYLPHDLKAKLALTAEASGRSEADLIREGVRLVVERTPRPAPRIPLFESGIPHLAERADDYLKGFGER